VGCHFYCGAKLKSALYVYEGTNVTMSLMAISSPADCCTPSQ